MDPKDKGNAAPETPAASITQSQVVDARTAGVQEGKAAGVAEGAAAGAAAERTRVAGILTHAEAGGRAKLAEHLAFKTAMTVEEAAAMLAAAPKEVAATVVVDPLAAAMANVTNPRVGAGSDEGEETAATVSARILSYTPNRRKPQLASVKK